MHQVCSRSRGLCCLHWCTRPRAVWWWVIHARLLAAVLLHRMARSLSCTLLCFLVCSWIECLCSHCVVVMRAPERVDTKWYGERTLGGLERAVQRGVEGNMSGWWDGAWTLVWCDGGSTVPPQWLSTTLTRGVLWLVVCSAVVWSEWLEWVREGGWWLTKWAPPPPSRSTTTQSTHRRFVDLMNSWHSPVCVLWCTHGVQHLCMVDGWMELLHTNTTCHWLSWMKNKQNRLCDKVLVVRHRILFCSKCNFEI